MKNKMANNTTHGLRHNMIMLTIIHHKKNAKKKTCGDIPMPINSRSFELLILLCNLYFCIQVA